MNDSLETGGARNRTTKGARSSRFVVQMTLPIRMLRHPAGSSPRLNPSPWNPPLGSRKGSQRGQRRVLGRVEPPTIFRDRNLILSDVNQERERGRKRERKGSYVPPSPTLLLPLLSTRPTPRPFIFSIFNRWMGAVTIIFTIRRTDWMINSRLFQAVCPP